LYEVSGLDLEDKKARYVQDAMIVYACPDNKTMLLQEWRGLFRSTLFLQTFAAHLTATEGAQQILGLHGPDKTTPAAIGAIGLVAASVSINILSSLVRMF
jgi:hypothetical protein